MDGVRDVSYAFAQELAVFVFDLNTYWYIVSFIYIFQVKSSVWFLQFLRS